MHATASSAICSWPFVWTGGDTHLYNNHMDQTHLQLSRELRPLPVDIIKRKPESILPLPFRRF